MFRHPRTLAAVFVVLAAAAQAGEGPPPIDWALLDGPVRDPPVAPWGREFARSSPDDPRSAAASAAVPPERLAWRNAAIISAGSAAFAAYGLNNWWDTGFGGGFKTQNEGWFGAGTQYGGADKLGHMYVNYANVRLLTPLFQAAGNSHDASVRLAGWTTVGIFGAIEVLDGLSRRYDFSAQDATMNLLGAALGVVMENDPDLDRKFDFRFAYRPSAGSGFEPFGDYSGQRYLLVAKADGFSSLRDVPVLRYLEVGVGYQAIGFDPGGERRRELSLSVSLNLSRLLADGAYGGRVQSTPVQRGADRVFDLLQFPTEAVVRRQLD